jgi:hypothetical protein
MLIELFMYDVISFGSRVVSLKVRVSKGVLHRDHYSTVKNVLGSATVKTHYCSIFGKENAVEVATGEKRFLVSLYSIVSSINYYLSLPVSYITKILSGRLLQ